MIDTLHAGGTRLILWQIPVLKHCTPNETFDERQNKIDEQYWIDNKLCVIDDNDEPYRVRSPWFIGSLVPDFTNAKTADWWVKQREYLVKEMGVDGFKTDGGEHLWTKTARFSDGTIAKGRANSFPALYFEVYDRFLTAARGKDSFLFSRAGYTGVQQHPGHWAGDEDSNWEAFRSSMFAMLSMSLSGEPFVGWDIAGFGGEPPSAELYIRASAFSVFCPIMQYHSEYNAHQIPSRDRTPWNIQERTGDQAVISEFRKLTNLRMNLMPYIQSQAWPIEFPEDVNAKKYPFQYLFGESLLAAPIVEEGKEECEIYLPAGLWRDFWTETEVEGSAIVQVKAARDSVPVYQREGSIVAFNVNDHFELFSDVGNNTESYQNLALRIFPGGGCRLDLVRGQGETIDPIEFKRGQDSQTWLLELPALDCPVEIKIYMDKPAAIFCGEKSVDWQWNKTNRVVRFTLAGAKENRTIKIN